MHVPLIKLIKCPVCEAATFTLQCFRENGDSVEEGAVKCSACKVWFRVEKGILDLMPLDLRRWDLYESFARKHSMVLNKEVISGEKAKTDQIEFFAEDSVEYDAQVTNSPIFLALDDVVVAGWLKQRSSGTSKLLDLGCGTGRQTVRAGEAGFSVVGVDISEEMLIVAKTMAVSKNLLGKIDFIIADAERFPVRDEIFDGCISIGTLHHVPHPDLVIREACRTVVSGGRLLFYDPHDSPVRFVFDFIMNIWKLYDEKASDEPLMTEDKMKQWLAMHHVESITRLSVFVPPHALCLFNRCLNGKILSKTDRFFNAIPMIRRCGGIIITEGFKKQ